VTPLGADGLPPHNTEEVATTGDDGGPLRTRSHALAWLLLLLLMLAGSYCLVIPRQGKGWIEHITTRISLSTTTGGGYAQRTSVPALPEPELNSGPPLLQLQLQPGQSVDRQTEEAKGEDGSGTPGDSDEEKEQVQKEQVQDEEAAAASNPQPAKQLEPEPVAVEAEAPGPAAEDAVKKEDEEAADKEEGEADGKRDGPSKGDGAAREPTEEEKRQAAELAAHKQRYQTALGEARNTPRGASLWLSSLACPM
jgi:hypothetical protein